MYQAEYSIKLFVEFEFLECHGQDSADHDVHDVQHEEARCPWMQLEKARWQHTTNTIRELQGILNVQTYCVT